MMPKPLPPTTAACVSGYQWTAPFVETTKPAGFGSVGGGAFTLGGTRYPDDVSAGREVSLTSPKGATRFDTAVENTPAPSYSGTTLTITTASNASLIVGGASISGGSKSTHKPTACVVGNVKKKQTVVLYGFAKWTNASKPLTTHFAVGGDLSIKHQSGASITQDTYK